MEIWDGYLEAGSLAGCDLIRGNQIPDGLFHLVSEVILSDIKWQSSAYYEETVRQRGK